MPDNRTISVDAWWSNEFGWVFALLGVAGVIIHRWRLQIWANGATDTSRPPMRVRLAHVPVALIGALMLALTLWAAAAAQGRAVTLPLVLVGSLVLMLSGNGPARAIGNRLVYSPLIRKVREDARLRPVNEPIDMDEEQYLADRAMQEVFELSADLDQPGGVRDRWRTPFYPHMVGVGFFATLAFALWWVFALVRGHAGPDWLSALAAFVAAACLGAMLAELHPGWRARAWKTGVDSMTPSELERRRLGASLFRRGS